ncbi:response regulator transcription factor [Alteromonas facilis]|uniref:response regulator transcription factor n=1 Tax=Alteromonas facilis TaxID=2048004 RepID=UPI000C285729|nr:response regulator transcription factor [Alteromonas facilis]
MSILVADDEQPLLRFIAKGLRAEGYECVTVNEYDEILEQIANTHPTVVVLDRLFGNRDSVELLTDIKALSPAPMVLMLTALDEVSERVKGLQEGADDYLCKPFDFDELLARIEALYRRSNIDSGADANVVALGTLTINLNERLAHLKGIELHLTKLEFDLLYYLVQNTGKVLSRERILTRVWQAYSDPQTNIIDVYISKLRKKLDSENNITIQTLRGNGYRLNFDSHG